MLYMYLYQIHVIVCLHVLVWAEATNRNKYTCRRQIISYQYRCHSSVKVQ